MAAPISLRLSDAKWREYSEQAQAAGIGLSTYLRRRLEGGDDLIEQLTAIRRMIIQSQKTTEKGEEKPLDNMLVEMLLLLRIAVGEAKMGVVHGELRRQGLQVWTGEKP
ncbi:hypothetical protein [Caballeronia sp. TF1N1]|uniref:hypothetical protein n=1 Tax=Caballeronia sp. TF1N1 TaxID=2878153 RepID=UPI001FD610CF|nr:hypothetical protein [Caballeronia sp. TF1N1]